MSNDKHTNKNATEAKTAPKVITCNLYNPTRARRVIYDGIEGSDKQITIAPGETKRGVTISRTIAEELRDRNRAKKDSDLQVRPQTTEVEETTKSPEPEKEPVIS